MPMYLTELAPLHLRGAMGVLCPLGVTFGVLLAQIMSLRDVLGKYIQTFLLLFTLKSSYHLCQIRDEFRNMSYPLA